MLCKFIIPSRGIIGLRNILITRHGITSQEAWEKLGNKGWSYDDVLPFFKKSCNGQKNLLKI